ncbi:Phenylacetic acid catabolic protein [Brevibacillus sp. B_LB10_24]|uniref:Phenylacetic acid catabolic protein n=1 Tax=Brevibacillus sp. B_LB10_24 TaxID=3380645 RepID=UPI0038B85182
MAEQTAGLTSLVNLIEQIADNKYVLGDRLVEVGISGPNLEATLSAIAMAQGELGHARLLYNWSFDLKGLKGKKPEIASQTGKAFPQVVAVRNWIELIAALYTVNVALELVLKALLEANHAELVHRIHKLLKEQKEHIIYSRGWAQQLLADGGAIPARFNESLDKVLPQAEAWLQCVEDSAELIDSGYLPSGTNLVAPFQKQIAELRASRTAVNAG